MGRVFKHTFGNVTFNSNSNLDSATHRKYLCDSVLIFGHYLHIYSLCTYSGIIYTFTHYVHIRALSTHLLIMYIFAHYLHIYSLCTYSRIIYTFTHYVHIRALYTNLLIMYIFTSNLVKNSFQQLHLCNAFRNISRCVISSCWWQHEYIYMIGVIYTHSGRCKFLPFATLLDCCNFKKYEKINLSNHCHYIAKTST